MPVSENFNTTNQYIKYNITVTESNVNASKNQSDITVSVKFWRTNTGYETYGWGTVYVTVDGTEYSQEVTSAQKITSAGIVLFNRKFTITHNSDGSKSVTVRAKLEHNMVNSDWNGFTVALTKIARSPSAPTTFTISAGYGNYVGLGDTINLSWSGASGTITGYQLQYSRGNSGWKDWKTQTGTSTTDSFTETSIAVNGAGNKVQYRVRAMNGSYASDWKASNILTLTGGMDLKVSNSWKQGSVWIKVNGSWKRAKRVWIKVNNNWQYSK